MCHEIQTDEVQKPWKRPFVQGSLLEHLDEQRHNGSCPNLAHDGVFVGANEAFDLQVLLDFLEEELDLPAVVVCVVPLNDSKLKLAASFSSGRTIEFKLLIAIVVTLAAAPLLQRRRYGIVLEASDECSASLREPGKERVVVVAAIHNDRYVGGRQFLDGCLCQCGIVYLSGSQIHYARH